MTNDEQRTTNNAPEVEFLLRQAVIDLAGGGCDTPRLDAELIVSHVLKQNRSWLYAHNRDVISADAQAQIQALVQRRLQREPLAYLVQHQEFYGLSFKLTPAVLIPRPETEMLVELALQHAPPQPCRLLDVGTGSGCIAIALTTHLPQAQLVAIDISIAALKVAQYNVEYHDLTERISLVQADMLTSLRPTLNTPIDIIVSNPPYIAHREISSLAPEVRDYEPRLALTDNADGLTLIRQLLSQANQILPPNGLLLVEIGADQAQAVLQLAQALAPQATFQIKQDLAGRDRVLQGCF